VSEGPEFLTVEEVAALLRVERRAVYAAIKKGQIPAIRVSRQLRIPRAFFNSIMETAKEAQRKDARGGQKE